ncbi:uncharacterized protein [Salminus brasiliensis]|uniref:uncharacterized protein isoform X2 n=1 Tax=Salminus brasiliensis TaxID=930266 RepID=UPI003B8346B4
MSFSCRMLVLVVLLKTAGSLDESVRVTCRSQTVCALRESVVNLDCSYSNIRPQRSFWFSPKQKAKWRKEEDPEDLASDPDYTGRVSYRSGGYSSISTLTIRDLRERDSGGYQLMLITETGDKYPSPTVVTLTVSDLQVKMVSDAKKQTKRTLNCSASCSLTSKPNLYHWFRNGQYINTNPRSQISVLSSSPGSYFCSVNNPNRISSSSVCVFDESCWSVLYSDRALCVLEGSSVDFPCTYSYPSGLTVTETYWFYSRPKVIPMDLSKEEQFAGRVEFLGDKERNCTLRMRDVRKNDSREYFFRFLTNSSEGKFFGRPGVILNVTDLQVRASPSAPSGGQPVTLTCSATCTLPNNPTYIWYKNGQPITNKPTRYNTLHLESANPEDVRQYSCALGGPEKKAVLKLITVGVPVFLALTLTGWLLIRRGTSNTGKGHRSTEDSGQCDSAAVYSNVSVLPLREVSEDPYSLCYSSLYFKPSQSPPTTSSLGVYIPEEQDVQYAAVNLSRLNADPQAPDADTDLPQIYSKIQKRKPPT